MKKMFHFIRWEKVSYFTSSSQLWILATIIILIIFHFLQFLSSVEYFLLLGSVREEFFRIEFRILESYLILQVSMVCSLYIFMSEFVSKHLSHITSSNFHSNSFLIIMILSRWTTMSKSSHILLIGIKRFTIDSYSWCHWRPSRQTFLFISPLFGTSLHFIFPLRW